MQNSLVFKTDLAKRTLGWLICLGAGGALAAMIYAIYRHPENQTPSELGSAVAIGIFLIGLMVAGIAIQYVRWSIEGETITSHRLFKNTVFPVSDLAGFGQIIVIVMVVPLQHVELYDHHMKHIARLPIGFRDWPKAEAWLAQRLRHVVNDGSPISPKLRFADAPKI